MRALLLLSLVFTSPVWAHEGEEEEKELDAGVTTPQTIVRSNRPVHAASEVVVARDVVNAAPRAGATDLLRLVPGLVASQHSGEGKAQQLFLRGFDAVHGQDVELNVAGLPVNEVSHVHALGYADLNWLIPETVREVKVTEGSGRAAQGDFAVAGTVRYELGLDEPGLTLAGGYGSFNRLRLFGGFRPQQQAETFAAVEYVQGDGFGAQRAFGRLSFLAQGVLKLDHVNFRAVIGSYATRFDSPGVVRDAAYESRKVGFFDAFGQSQGGAVSRHQLLLSAELPHENGRTTFELFGALIDLRLRNNFTGFLGNPAGDGLQQTQTTGMFGARALHQRHLHVGPAVLLLDVGLSARHDGIEQAQRGYDEADGALRAPLFDGAAMLSREALEVRISQNVASGWGELSWAPGGWRFMLGGRVDVLKVELHDSLAFGGTGTNRSALGPHFGLKVGIERDLSSAFRLFLSYGDGFRSPQARQLGDGERAPFVNVHGGELGVRYESSTLSASLAGFTSYVANDFFFDHTVGSTSFLGPTLRGGAQAAVTARPLEGLLLSANVTGATAQLLEREALLPYFAPLVGRLDASWVRPFVVRGVVVTPPLGLGATLLGPRPLPFDEFSRTVFLLDARAGVRVGPFELTVDLQNLLDSRWRDGEFVFASKWDPSSATSRLPSRQFTAGAPRTLFVSLEVHL
jgi:iron complex outermembrane recepter protein